MLVIAVLIVDDSYQVLKVVFVQNFLILILIVSYKGLIV